MSDKQFKSMPLHPGLLEMIEARGFTNPTPIQVAAIPLVLEGHDVMGQARTGTGKTAAYGIPVLNSLREGGGIQALTICPTRELALQVHDEISFLGRGLGIEVVAIYGGKAISPQIEALGRYPEVVVGTPGRLIDHLERRTLKLTDLKFIVLDEADEMLDMGFLPDIERILKQCPRARQTLLFSATLPEEVRQMGLRFMDKPQVILIDNDEPTVPVVEQRCYQVSGRLKTECLCQLFEKEQPASSLVFCRTRKGTDYLARRLKRRGYNTGALHGDMSQRERDTVMHRFRNGRFTILVATDLAARGLDIDHVTHVFNFDIPDSPDIYVHRIGRTARAGRSGVAITLVEPAQMDQLRLIEDRIGKQIGLENMSVNREAEQLAITNRLIRAGQEASPTIKEFSKRLLAQYNGEQLLTGALVMLYGENANNIIPSSRRRAAPEIKMGEDESVYVELPRGRIHGMSPRSLVDYIVQNSTIKCSQVGDIEIHRSSAYVEVPLKYADEVYNIFAALPKSIRTSEWEPPFPKAVETVETMK
ncbi:DEAD/DEAH box helicase [Syntrophomonas erecta subsp. sporosyntropha]